MKFVAPSNTQLETIEIGIFYKCGKLSKIECTNDNFYIIIDALYNKNKIKFYILLLASPIKYFSFPESVTSIESGALMSCVNLEVVFIPGSITNIGQSSFEICSGFKYINIPKSVLTVGKNAFSGCTKLTCDQSIENRSQIQACLKNVLAHVSVQHLIPTRVISHYHCHLLISFYLLTKM